MPAKRFHRPVTLSVVIVNYNVRAFLEHALVSLRTAARGLSVEFIVVDNASDDGSVAMVRKKFPFVKVIASSVNCGFACANNIALEHARGAFILLINPDTVVQEDTLRTMIDYLRTHPHVGLAGCKILNPDGTLQLACRRSFPTPWVAFTKISGLSRLFPSSQWLGKYNLTYLDEDATYAVDAVSGSFMMIRREVIDRVGGLDEQFFMYGEDLDWCYRIRQAGWDIAYVHETQIIHYKGESTRRSSIDEIRTFYDAMHLFVRKHFRHSGLTVAILRLSIALVSMGAWLRVSMRPLRDASIDSALIVAAMLLAEYWWRGDIFLYPAYAYPAVFVIPVLIVLSFQLAFGAYSFRRLSVVRSMTANVTAFILISALMAFFKTYAFSRMIIVIAGAMTVVLLPGWRLLVHLVGGGRSEGRVSAFGRRTLIVGTNKQARELLRRLRRRVGAGYDVFGFIDTTNRQVGERLDGTPVLGTIGNAAKVSDQHRITDLIVAPDALTYAQVLALTASTRRSVAVHLVPGTMEVIVGKASVDHLDEVPLVEITYNIARPWHRFSKRLADVLLGGLLFILVSPIFHLRRMAMGTAPPPVVLGLQRVLSGEWSLVGPPAEAGERAGQPETVMFLGKPGLTGLVQLQNGLSREEEEQYGLYYARNQSFVLDLEILLKSVLRRRV